MHVVLPVAMGIGIAAPGSTTRSEVRRTLSFVRCPRWSRALRRRGGVPRRDGRWSDLRVAVAVAVLAALALEPVRRLLVRRAERVAFGQEVTRDELLGASETRSSTPSSEAPWPSRSRRPPGKASASSGCGWRFRGRPRCTRAAGWTLRGAGVHRRPAPRPRTARHDLLRPLHRGHSPGRGFGWTPSPPGRDGADQRPLAEELNRQLAEVDASRRRLVAARRPRGAAGARPARRRQQDLAALLTRIALARNQLGRADLDRSTAPWRAPVRRRGSPAEPPRAGVGHPRDHAGRPGAGRRGRGRAPSCRSRSRSASARVSGRACSPPVESTAYFTVCEALANTLKHGDAAHAVRRPDAERRPAPRSRNRRRPRVRPARVNGSTGLTGLRDRVAAIGGTLEVRSTPAGVRRSPPSCRRAHDHAAATGRRRRRPLPAARGPAGPPRRRRRGQGLRRRRQRAGADRGRR